MVRTLKGASHSAASEIDATAIKSSIALQDISSLRPSALEGLNEDVFSGSPLPPSLISFCLPGHKLIVSQVGMLQGRSPNLLSPEVLYVRATLLYETSVL